MLWTAGCFICPGETYDFYGVEINQPGTYVDTIPQGGVCDSIISLHLYIHNPEDIGVEDTVTMALTETITLTANEGFVSYKWNDGVTSQDNLVTVLGSELGEGTHDYIVEVETVHGCIQTDTIKLIVSSSSGVRESEEMNFSVYPNPFGNEGLHIDYTVSAEAVLMVYDQVGREISRKILYPSENHVRIFLPVETGLYNLVIVTDKGTRHMKVVKL